MQATLYMQYDAKKPLPKEAASQVGALHASHRSQRQLGTHITNGVDAGHGGLVLIIHLHTAIVLQRYSNLHSTNPATLLPQLPAPAQEVMSEHAAAWWLGV